MEGKKTKGRQKIEMKRIENEEERLITFSKRKSGIYKKASELVTLTGAKVAFVVFSPAGKPFSFGHPSVDEVVNRFLGQEPGPNDVTHPLVEAQRQMRINELTMQLNEELRLLDESKEKAKQLKQKTKKKVSKGWWDTPIEELNLQKLLQMEDAYEAIRLQAVEHIKMRTNGASSSSMQPADQTFTDSAQMPNFPTFDANANEEANPTAYPPAGFHYEAGSPK